MTNLVGGGGVGFLTSPTLGENDMGSLKCGPGNVLDKKIIGKEEVNSKINTCNSLWFYDTFPVTFV